MTRLILVLLIIITAPIFAQDDPPAGFEFEISTLQAFYFFNEAKTPNGELLTSNDWVAAFNGNVCLGAKQWDVDACGGMCDVPIMGDDGSDWTEGYATNGFIPSFKIYIASEDRFYPAIPSENIPWENFGLPFLDSIQAINAGCTDENALNHDPNAEVDDGSCDYGQPDEFYYEQSTLQAFYFINEANDIYGQPLQSNDWVAIFKGDICVGAKQWDVVECGGICDVPAMGDDGSEYTSGYMTNGDIPSFIVFDASENTFYSAQPSEIYPWENFGLPFIATLDAYESSVQTIELHKDNNLISFYTLPENSQVSSIFADFSHLMDGYGIIGENYAAQINPQTGEWTGSLSHVNTYEGYWVGVESPATISIEGPLADPEKIYSLHYGLNLISFPVAGTVGISDGIPDDIEGEISFVITESKATMQVNGEWVGSLASFESGKGYWINSNTNMQYQYDLTTLSRAASTESLNLFENEIYQSKNVAFYFVDATEIASVGDIILAYNGNELVGANKFNGDIIDIAVRGSDGHFLSSGYCQYGDTPRFELNTMNGQKIVLDGDIPQWSNLHVELISLHEEAINAKSPNIHSIYPNPFNPSTEINIEIPRDDLASLMVFDIRGNLVKEIFNTTISEGTHSITWSPENISSGTYFVQLKIGEIVETQKVVYLK